MGARGLPLVAERDHLAQLAKCETDGLTGMNERDPAERVLTVVAIPSGCSLRHLKQALRFIEADGLGRQSRLGGQLPDQRVPTPLTLQYRGRCIVTVRR